MSYSVGAQLCSQYSRDGLNNWQGLLCPVLPARHRESSGCYVRKRRLFTEVWLVLWSCWIPAGHCLVLCTCPSSDHSKTFSEDLKEMHLTLERRLQGSLQYCPALPLLHYVGALPVLEIDRFQDGLLREELESSPAHLELLLHLPGCHWEAPISLCFPDSLGGSWSSPKSTLYRWIISLAGVYGILTDRPRILTVPPEYSLQHRSMVLSFEDSAPCCYSVMLLLLPFFLSLFPPRSRISFLLVTASTLFKWCYSQDNHTVHYIACVCVCLFSSRNNLCISKFMPNIYPLIIMYF